MTDHSHKTWEPAPPGDEFTPPPNDDWMVLVVFGVIAAGFFLGLVILSLSLM